MRPVKALYKDETNHPKSAACPRAQPTIVSFSFRSSVPVKIRAIGNMIGTRNPPSKAGKKISFRFSFLTERK